MTALSRARSLLARKIAEEAELADGQILLTDRFLNQQMDIPLYEAIGEAFAEVFSEDKVTKVLTIEASGIALAFVTAQVLRVPAVFAKKKIPLNIGKNYYMSEAYSYTKEEYFPLTLSDYLLGPEDRVLIVDDFLARGEALGGLIRLCRDAGAEVVGAGIAVEKRFQGGYKKLEAAGIPLCSLYVLNSFEDFKKRSENL